jgi:uncharacterized OB-fold protein
VNDDIRVPSIGMALMGAQPITPDTAGHWQAAAEGRFTVPTCDHCGTNYWPVTHVCYVCGSREWGWQPVGGTGTVYTYTWIDAPIHPTTRLQNIAVIELDGTKGEPVRVPGWVVGVDKDTLACAIPVEVEFDQVGEGVAVPYWRPR